MGEVNERNDFYLPAKNMVSVCVFLGLVFWFQLVPIDKEQVKNSTELRRGFWSKIQMYVLHCRSVGVVLCVVLEHVWRLKPDLRLTSGCFLVVVLMILGHQR